MLSMVVNNVGVPVPATGLPQSRKLML